MTRKNPLESERDYSDYYPSELLHAYQILEVAEKGLKTNDDEKRKIIKQRMTAVSKELAKRVLPE